MISAYQMVGVCAKSKEAPIHWMPRTQIFIENVAHTEIHSHRDGHKWWMRLFWWCSFKLQREFCISMASKCFTTLRMRLSTLIIIDFNAKNVLPDDSQCSMHVKSNCRCCDVVVTPNRRKHAAAWILFAAYGAAVNGSLVKRLKF